jgi:hypothetical protein
MLAKDKLERRKHMEVWRWESQLASKKVSRIPSTVIRSSPKRMGYSSGFSESPRRRNTAVYERIAASVLMGLTKMFMFIRNKTKDRSR